MAAEACSEIPVRYYEQCYTTVETMRRRCLAVYDCSAALVQRGQRCAEKFREWAEPAALDYKDYVTAAVMEKASLSGESKATRNDLVELYLAIGVHTIAMASGFIGGSFFFGGLVNFIFDRSFVLILLALIPVYTYLYMTKGAVLDDTEARLVLYVMVLIESTLAGSLVGNRMAVLIPAAAFAIPVVTGLLIDKEIAPEHLFADRDKFVLYAGLGGAVLAFGLALPFGAATFGALVCILLHAGFLAVHFQLTMADIKSNAFSAAQSQFAYMLVLSTIHVLCAFVFGSSSPAGQPATSTK
ncbi:hypothetical protein L596_012072 [Steinernema carpocapsae]|uniref:Uncharacterized protein n=1 Tax=Steinernema carpocapsae TaxID=34508 RepID=A0A4U5NW68_STECR|nr:hypothetical protein L596_012072 [Steinernema carpocapsae]